MLVVVEGTDQGQMVSAGGGSGCFRLTCVVVPMGTDRGGGVRDRSDCQHDITPANNFNWDVSFKVHIRHCKLFSHTEARLDICVVLMNMFCWVKWVLMLFYDLC